MQASARTIATAPRPDRVPPGAKTPWGQTAEHIPQLIHAPALNLSVFSVLTEMNSPSEPHEHPLVLGVVGAQHPFVVPQHLAIEVSLREPAVNRQAQCQQDAGAE